MVRRSWVWMLLLGCRAPSDADKEDTDAVADTDTTPACDPVVAWVDADGDGHGGTEQVERCPEALGPQHVDNADDCDDTRAEVHPGAEEVCDGLDTDCSGEATPEDELSDFWLDGDGDGHGAGTPTASCEPPDVQWVSNSDDCDDTRPDVYPGAVEVCGDGVDTDCTDDSSLAPDGSDYVLVPTNGDVSFQAVTSGGRTVEVWVWLDGNAPSSAEYGLLDKRRDEPGPISADTDYSLFLYDDLVYWGTGPAADLCAWMAVPMGLRDQWVHIAATLEPTGPIRGNKSLFVNGELQATCHYDERGEASPSFDLVVGAALNPVGLPLDGYLDEVRISSTVRYTGDFAPEPLLTADSDTLLLFHFDEGAGTVITDASGRGNDGTYTAGGMWHPASPCDP